MCQCLLGAFFFIAIFIAAFIATFVAGFFIADFVGGFFAIFIASFIGTVFAIFIAGLGFPVGFTAGLFMIAFLAKSAPAAFAAAAARIRWDFVIVVPGVVPCEW